MRQQIFWTADEYRAIAAKLDPRNYPNALVDGFVPGLTLSDLNQAVKAALPLERQRKMANQAHISSFGRRLRDTLAGKEIWTREQYVANGEIERPREPIPEQVAQHEKDTGSTYDPNAPRTQWKQDEWEAVVRKLYELEPALVTDFDSLRLSRLNEAAALMARPRRFYRVGAPWKFLLGARARLAAADSKFHRAPPPAPAEDAPAPLPTQAYVPPDPDDEPFTPRPPRGPDVFARIEWTRDEWLVVAQELHRLNPIANYPYRGNLTGLDSQDVAWAQERVLPLPRQRRHLKVASFTTLRVPLLRAFDDLRAKLEAEKPQAAPQPAQEAAQEPAAPFPIYQPDPAQEARQAAVNPFEAAFAPLVAMLAGAVTAQLKPMISALVDDAVLKLAVAAEPAQVAQVAATVEQAAAPVLASVLTAKPKPKRLTVGVLVNMTGNYKTELERLYPMIEVKLGDCSHAHAADRIVNCDKVFCLIKWADKMQSQKLKKQAGDRYSECPGGMADLKRMVGIWLRSQGVQVEVAA